MHRQIAVVQQCDERKHRDEEQGSPDVDAISPKQRPRDHHESHIECQARAEGQQCAVCPEARSRETHHHGSIDHDQHGKPEEQLEGRHVEPGEHLTVDHPDETDEDHLLNDLRGPCAPLRSPDRTLLPGPRLLRQRVGGDSQRPCRW